MSVGFPKQNNFELVRLLLACQVMIVHVFEHIEDKHFAWLSYFPGVPAFFFLSGFLIYASYTKSESLSSYFTNRFLRLYPALIVVVLAGLLLILYAKGFYFLIEKSGLLLLWIVSQLTFLQAFNPSEFRDIGVGVINGSLWTISVELMFYIAVPIIFSLEKKFKYTVHVLLFTSLAFYVSEPHLSLISMGQKTLFDYLSLTPVVWGWMFLLGVLAYKDFDFIKNYLRFFWVALPVCLLIAIAGGEGVFLKPNGNSLGVLYFLSYVVCLLYISFKFPVVKISFDLSYGIYIWHMIAVNFFLLIGFSNVLLVIFSTVFISLLSWFYIEKPALMLKRYSLKNGCS